MFHLTPQERRAVIVVVLIFIVGTAVQWLLHKNAKPTRWVSQAHQLSVNVNTANASQLQMLPGIGVTLASKIMSYRQEHGPFLQIEDLRKVKGITDKRLKKMKGLVEL